MQSDRMRLISEERARLEKEKEARPDLFPERVWADNNQTLETLGIHIPNKNNLPDGYLKLLPSDFIVEEITLDGLQTTVGVSSDKAFSDEPGDTVYATLIKCGLSTIEAVEELSKLLNLGKEKIQYAGIKDKEAITSQAISFRGTSKPAVEAIKSPHFFLKDIRSGKGVVVKGGLKANRFTILIRIPADMENDSKMKRSLEALEKVRKEGFYNFFYLQRFGTPRLNNYKWGLSILKGDYEKAIRGLISDSGLREIPFFLEMRKEIIALAPNWSQVLEKLNEFPLVFPSEIKVVEHLTKNPTDFRGALQKIEEQVVLWVSALASLLYNRKVSSYIIAGIEPPKRLPLFLSFDKNDWLPYSDDLEGAGVFPPNLNNLRPFPRITLMHKDIETKDHADILGAEVVPEGIIVNFTLGKGEYATTFLSHFVTLLNGKPSDDTTESVIDIKEKLNQTSLAETLKYFEALNQPK